MSKQYNKDLFGVKDILCGTPNNNHTTQIINPSQHLTRTVSLDISSMKDSVFGNNSTVVPGITLNKIVSLEFYIVHQEKFYDAENSDDHFKKIKLVLFTNDIDNQGKSHLEGQQIYYKFNETVMVNNQPSFVFLSPIRNSNEPTSFILEGQIMSGANPYTGVDTVNVKCKITYKPPTRNLNR